MIAAALASLSPAAASGAVRRLASALRRLLRPGGARLDLAAIEIVLAENRPLRLRRAGALRLACTGGIVWVTAPGLRDDVFLFRGDAVDIDSDGLVLVEAVGAGCRVRLGAAGRGRDSRLCAGGRTA